MAEGKRSGDMEGLLFIFCLFERSLYIRETKSLALISSSSPFFDHAHSNQFVEIYQRF
jgi:hypothetical protein